MGKIECKCINCGKIILRYKSQVLATVFCSRECRSQYNKENFTLKLSCEECGKSFRKRKANVKGRHHFCSKECKGNWQKHGLKGANNPFYNKTHSEETLRRLSKKLRTIRLKGEKSPRYCRVNVKCETCGKEFKIIPYLKARSKRHYCSIACHAKGKSEYSLGENGSNYNPNLTEEERLRRRTIVPRYSTFRKSVLERDGNKCVICGATENLIAHHLNSYHWDKENRSNPDNGVCVCSKHHSDFHSKYTYKFNTKEQFIEYAKSV